MIIYYCTDAEGGFVVGDSESRVVQRAPAGSCFATLARFNSPVAAKEMLDATDNLTLTYEYDVELPAPGSTRAASLWSKLDRGPSILIVRDDAEHLAAVAALRRYQVRLTVTVLVLLVAAEIGFARLVAMQ